MESDKESEELKKFAAVAAGNTAADAARNRQIITRFHETVFDPQNRMKNHIRLSLSGQREKTTTNRPFIYKIAVAAACMILAALLYWPCRFGARRPEIAPDYYAYYNFPSTGDEAMLYLAKTPPDCLDFHRFPSMMYTGKI